MAEFNIRSDSVDVEQIMNQIRARIREKRGVDYTEEEIRELASAKLERFLDPQKVRSDLLAYYRKQRHEEAPIPNYAFEDTTLFDSHRAPLRWLRRLLKPVLKLFFNPNPLIQALHLQSRLNDRTANDSELTFELVHNLVVELTRTSIEVRNLRMRVEAMASRLDFDERRARALEGIVRCSGSAGADEETGKEEQGGDNQDSYSSARPRRRKRRRRRSSRPPAQVARMIDQEGGDTAADASNNETSGPDEADADETGGDSEPEA